MNRPGGADAALRAAARRGHALRTTLAVIAVAASAAALLPWRHMPARTGPQAGVPATASADTGGMRSTVSAPWLSAFEAAKAETLLRERLPCLGCHQLDGAGGRIGPDLSNVGDRRTAAFIMAMIREPQRVVPGTIMPKAPIPPQTSDLIARYLAARAPAGGIAGADAPAAGALAADPAARSPASAGAGAEGLVERVADGVRPGADGRAGQGADRAVERRGRQRADIGSGQGANRDAGPGADGRASKHADRAAERRGRQRVDIGSGQGANRDAGPGADRGPEQAAAALYGRYCVPCHGPDGAGDGANAPFLAIPPTAHADAAYMSTRTDDALFDAIFAGGRVMGRSHLMPAFGWTLERSQIRGLVAYLRQLCGCQGPAWSRDGAP